MDYKEIVAQIILYSTKRIKLAETDYNITGEECFEGEMIYGVDLLSYIESLLGGKKDDIKSCINLVDEVMGEYDGKRD